MWKVNVLLSNGSSANFDIENKVIAEVKRVLKTGMETRKIIEIGNVTIGGKEIVSFSCIETKEGEKKDDKGKV